MSKITAKQLSWSIWNDKDHITLSLFNAYVKQNEMLTLSFFAAVQRSVAVEGKAKCLKRLLEFTDGADVDRVMFQIVVYGTHRHQHVDTMPIIGILLSVGAKLPTEAAVREHFVHGREELNKTVVFLRDIRIGFNRAQKAALTLLMIKRFHPLEGMLRHVNMDVMRLIARMVYASGAYEWKMWRNKRVVVSRKRRKILGKRK